MAAKPRSWEALSPRYRGRLERALRKLGHADPKAYYESGGNLQRARGHEERREHIVRRERRERRRAGGGGTPTGPGQGMPGPAVVAALEYEQDAPPAAWREWLPLLLAAERAGDAVEYDRIASWLQRLRALALAYAGDPDAPKGSWSDYFRVSGEAMQAYPQLKLKAFWYHW